MIGRLAKTVFDCPDPRALATFDAAVLGMRVNEDDGDGASVVIGRDTGCRELAFRRASPGGRRRRRGARGRALGATRLHDVDDEGFRVFADPAGHPFCLVF